MLFSVTDFGDPVLNLQVDGLLIDLPVSALPAKVVTQHNPYVAVSQNRDMISVGYLTVEQQAPAAVFPSGSAQITNLPAGTRIQTDDGYTLTVEADGTVTDGDLSWDSLAQLSEDVSFSVLAEQKFTAVIDDFGLDADGAWKRHATIEQPGNADKGKALEAMHAAVQRVAIDHTAKNERCIIVCDRDAVPMLKSLGARCSDYRVREGGVSVTMTDALQAKLQDYPADFTIQTCASTNTPVEAVAQGPDATHSTHAPGL